MMSVLAPLVVVSLLAATTEDEISRPVRGHVEVVYLRPIGSLADTYSTAVGTYVGADTHVAGPYFLSAKAGYLAYASRPADVDGRHLSAIQVLGGPRYHFFPSDISAHVGLNVGLNGVFEASPQQPVAFTVHFAWQLELGMTIWMPGAGGLEIAGRYNAHFLEHDRMMTGWELGIAVLF